MSNLYSVVLLYTKNRNVRIFEDIASYNNNIGQLIHNELPKLDAVIIQTDNNSYYYHSGSLTRDGVIQLYNKLNCVLTDPLVVRQDAAILQDILSQLYAEMV